MSARKAKPTFRPCLELLESRVVPSGSKPKPPPPAEYNLTDLGVLAGHTGSTAFDVNGFGLAIGKSWVSGPSATERAFLVVPRDTNGDGKLDWYANAGNVNNSTNTLMTELTTISGPSFSNSSAQGINELGQVVGFYQTTSNDAHAFLITPRDMNSDGKLDWNWDGNGDGTNDLMADLGTLGGVGAAALNLNDKGQVVGWAKDDAGNAFPFLWNPSVPNGSTGQMINLGTFGVADPRPLTVAAGINEAGQVVGKVLLLDVSGNFGYVRGFVITPRDVDNDGDLDWNHDANGDGKNDLMVDLGVLSNVSSEACAINDAGVIVGEAGSNLSRIDGHAVRWTPQSGSWSIADLGGLHGKLYHSAANDINNTGIIAGYSQAMIRTVHGGGGVAAYEAVGERRAFVHDGTMKALDTLVSSMAGFTYLNEAKAIADNRHIVGEGKVGTARHAYIAVPVVSSLQAQVTGPGSSDLLTITQIQPSVMEALSRWAATGVGVSALASIDIRIADLGGTTLGLASGHTIWLDDNAAGWGWFVDKTPWEDSEFTRPGNQGEKRRIDLLSVLMHEVGHLLGRDHDDGGVMTETLASGKRLTPQGAVVQPPWDLFAVLDFKTKRAQISYVPQPTSAPRIAVEPPGRYAHGND